MEGMRQKTKEIMVPRGKFRLLENSDHFTNWSSSKKNSVSCSEFHPVQNCLNLRKMRFSANFPSSYTNVSISGEFGNATRKNKAILKLIGHGYGRDRSYETTGLKVRNNTRN